MIYPTLASNFGFFFLNILVLREKVEAGKLRCFMNESCGFCDSLKEPQTKIIIIE